MTWFRVHHLWIALLVIALFGCESTHTSTSVPSDTPKDTPTISDDSLYSIPVMPPKITPPSQEEETTEEITGTQPSPDVSSEATPSTVPTTVIVEPRDDSPGPPDFVCGEVGYEPCGDEIKIDAILVGDATNWGCKGKNLYFTPHNGGECWRCPDGYRRTWTPIHKPDSCKERGLGFNKERTDATFERSVYGCEDGQFEKGGECYRCPTGSSKVSFLWAFNPGAECKTEFYCKDDLALMPAPPEALQNFGPPYDRICGEPFNAESEVIKLAREEVNANMEINQAAAAFLAEASTNSALKRAIKDKDGDAAYQIISAMESYQQLRATALLHGYRSMTLGGGPELEVGIGATTEYGIALDWHGNSRPYGSVAISKGVSLSAGIGLTLGIWKDGIESSEANIGGYARGASISVPLGVADIGSAAWFSYYPLNFIGLTFSGSGGIGLETVNYNQAVTMLY
ncbi:hypothetical protein LRP49_12360 [Enterovibrio sp. ZSDZ35]|uniref:Uncharacterized protein n=1 Tax=Enterovibrio qingdaonensis TaxID=2899818 RepID=A0ABT5QLW9_9GAMM|nr:hypothetical protein [Enterovibrio sp. ZSDZ35]MDD1781963.1 hypothetical protein [Enterovibrio sp. ZSDZ35]